jgi:hypothetical protein
MMESSNRDWLSILTNWTGGGALVQVSMCRR